jgi:hypothetical protein
VVLNAELKGLMKQAPNSNPNFRATSLELKVLMQVGGVATMTAEPFIVAQVR